MVGTIIGIDPGKTGALAFYEEGCVVPYHVHDTPGSEREMASLVNEFTIPRVKCHAFVEKVHAMPGQGVVSMFTFGQNFGTWLGILSAFGIPYTLVAPQTWKKEMLADMPKEKDSSVKRVLQLFPEMADQFKRKKDHNRADALLLLEYGRRRFEVKNV